MQADVIWPCQKLAVVATYLQSIGTNSTTDGWAGARVSACAGTRPWTIKRQAEKEPVSLVQLDVVIGGPVCGTELYVVSFSAHCNILLLEICLISNSWS